MSDHDHTARDVGAAHEKHEHDVLDVYGAAREHHSHTGSDLGGVPTLAQLQDLKERIGTLNVQLEELRAMLEAERQVGAAVADGNRTIERIVTAMRSRAQYLKRGGYVSPAKRLEALADEIERTS